MCLELMVVSQNMASILTPSNEIKHGNQVAPKSSEHEKRECEINDDHEYDFLHKKIGAEAYDCIDSAQNCSSSDIENVKICRCDEMNDYDKIIYIAIHSTNI